MSVPPNRVTEAQDELRGDYREFVSSLLSPAMAAGAALSPLPLFVDGRLPMIEGQASVTTLTPTSMLSPNTVTSAVVSVAAINATTGAYPVTVTAGTGQNFAVGAATINGLNCYIQGVAGDVLTVRGLAAPPAAAQVVTQTPYSGAGGRGDTGGQLWRVSATPQAALTGQATNFVTLQLALYNGGALRTNIGNAFAFNVATQVWEAGDIVDLAVPPGTIYNPGDVLMLVTTPTGTGLAVPAMLWSIEASRFGV